METFLRLYSNLEQKRPVSYFSCAAYKKEFPATKPVLSHIHAHFEWN